MYNSSYCTPLAQGQMFIKADLRHSTLQHHFDKMHKTFMPIRGERKLCNQHFYFVPGASTRNLKHSDVRMIARCDSDALDFYIKAIFLWMWNLSGDTQGLFVCNCHRLQSMDRNISVIMEHTAFYHSHEHNVKFSTWVCLFAYSVHCWWFFNSPIEKIFCRYLNYL